MWSSQLQTALVLSPSLRFAQNYSLTADLHTWTRKGLNVPTGLNTSGGITTTANGALIRGIGVVAVGVGIICIGPEVGIALAY